MLNLYPVLPHMANGILYKYKKKKDLTHSNFCFTDFSKVKKNKQTKKTILQFHFTFPSHKNILILAYWLHNLGRKGFHHYPSISSQFYSSWYQFPVFDIMTAVQYSLWDLEFYIGNFIFIYTHSLKRLNPQVSCMTYHFSIIMQATMIIILK